MKSYTGKRTRGVKVRPVLIGLLIAAGIPCIVLRSFGMRFTGFLCLGIAGLLAVSLLLGVLARRGRFWRGCRVVFYLCVAVGLVGFGVLEGQIFSAERSAPAEADAAIVLGAGVNGTKPSLTLRSRLETALSYAEEYPDTVLVLTGGKGYGEDISEAECMRRYLVKHGVAESRLLLEDQSTSTAENFRCAGALLEKNGYAPQNMRLAVISNDFHLYRAELLARREGLTVTGIGAPIPWLHLEINYTVREAFALAKMYWL